MTRSIRVVLADDHPLFRRGVCLTLSALGNCEVVAECDNTAAVVQEVCDHVPDVVLLDVSMPGGGVAAARTIADRCPAVRIIMLTASENENDMTEALEAGASGYILKGVGGEQLVQIIEAVHDGRVYVSPQIATRALLGVQTNIHVNEADPFAKLSAQEQQILEGIAHGQTNKEIAAVLDVNEHTVDRHVTNVLQKIQVRSRLEAAIKAHDYLAGRQEKDDVRYSEDDNQAET